MIEALLKEHLSGIRATRLLDVGPGYGNFSRIAAAATGAREIVYLDCDDAVLRFQQDQSAAVGLTCSAQRLVLTAADLAKLPGRFDVILCQEVLEHLSNAEEVLAALAARLAPDGVLIITVPTRSSERWLKFINPGYMRDEPFGHVRQFDRAALLQLLRGSGLQSRVLRPAQPQYLVAHTWLNATRMKVEGSTGRVLTTGFRATVFNALLRMSGALFRLTGWRFWSWLLPRNYFVVAGHQG